MYRNEPANLTFGASLPSARRHSLLRDEHAWHVPDDIDPRAHQCNVTLKGVSTVADEPGFAEGVNTYQGAITNKSVAEALDVMNKYRPLADLLKL